MRPAPGPQPEIIVITDNARATAPLCQALRRAGYPVTAAPAEPEGLREALGPRPPRIVVLDGTSVRLTPTQLRRLLKRQFPSHEAHLVWLVTQEQLHRLDPASVDDFLVLPASADELLARLRLLLWRARSGPDEQAITVGDLVIDQATYTVQLNGKALDLTYKEYELLRFLAAHRGRVFTREALLDRVWGYDYYGGTRTVDVHIRRIRAKLGPERKELVETVRNVGYRFSDAQA